MIENGAYCWFILYGYITMRGHQTLENGCGGYTLFRVTTTATTTTTTTTTTTAIELSLGGSSPYTSTDKKKRINIHKRN